MNVYFNQNPKVSEGYKWPHVSIDKISFTLHNSFFNQATHCKPGRCISVSDAGSYYRKINIHAEYINPNGELIFNQVHNAILQLYLDNCFYTGEFTPYEFLSGLFSKICQKSNLSEVEIAFDIPKRRVNFQIAENYFNKYKNSRYSKDYKQGNSTKDSLLCLYNRTKKSIPDGQKQKYSDDVWRFEFRLKRYELTKLFPGKTRTLENCYFLYQNPSDFIKNLSFTLSTYIQQLHIPSELFTTYRDHRLLEKIMKNDFS